MAVGASRPPTPLQSATIKQAANQDSAFEAKDTALGNAARFMVPEITFYQADRYNHDTGCWSRLQSARL